MNSLWLPRVPSSGTWYANNEESSKFGVVSSETLQNHQCKQIPTLQRLGKTDPCLFPAGAISRPHWEFSCIPWEAQLSF
ncbi:hypothetical protein Mapa_017268 [Marchantia paleacea]|nr:hypothetical protein Mapa_017268 [Marchantia paleacea]